MKLVYHKTKKNALKALEAIDSKTHILCNRSVTKYFILENHQSFLNCIISDQIKDFYEYIPSNIPVPLFFDIEIYKESSEYFDNPESLLEIIFEKLDIFLESSHSNCIYKKYILESHNSYKKSYHVVCHITDKDNNLFLFSNVKQLKEFYKLLQFNIFIDHNKHYLIDPSVYREGLFRTIYSSKNNENRPLISSVLSDECEDIFTFISYYKTLQHNVIDYDKLLANYKKTPNVKNDQANQIEEININETNFTNDANINNNESVNIPEELNEEHKKIIIKFIQKEYRYTSNKIRDIFIDKEHNCIIVALSEKFCPFEDREHKSNNQYIVIDTTSSKQKCHDPVCNPQKYGEIKLEMYPKEIHEIIKKCLKINKQELELIDKAIEECKNYITENFDADIQHVSFDRNAMIFRGNVADRSLAKILKGKCPECNVEHQISDGGYCLKCKECNSIFPKNQIIPVDGRYKTLNSFWMNYHQLVNNGTINNIINIYNGGDIEFSCDIKLDNSIFKNKEITNIVNQVLDGHKITMISKLLYTIDKDFIYSKNNWYYFSGSIWKSDSDNIEMKKEIMELSKMFDRIKTHYDEKQTDESTMTLNKNIKSLINKYHKPGFQDDVIKGAKIYYNDEGFISNLNSKKHLLPFLNGVYDLLDNKFRKTKKDDFINLTVNYEYNPNANNPEVYTFLNQVLPNQGVRDYVLKKMSECLNGDIPNTYFLMFIGDSGANGKSQLLNLMKLAMGDFGEKVEVTLLTRKRNNANEANTEKVKLMNKRFAFLSEPEDGEKINIGLLKELTGSEEIVARGLYQDSLSFVMEAKLFLACNELPEIKGEDTALWRRIRVIDFPSRFVDEPKEADEYKIDRTLPSRMRENISWRQTFMKILLEYYYKDISEPNEVKLKTNEYRQENNEFFNWMEENIEYKENALLQLKDVCLLFLNKQKIHSKESTKYKKEIEKYIKEKYKNLKWEHGKIKLSANDYVDENTKTTCYGWKHLVIKE